MYTVLVLIEIYFKLIPFIVSVLCSGQNFCKFSETTEPTIDKFYVAPPLDRGKGSYLPKNVFVCFFNCIFNENLATAYKADINAQPRV